MRWLLPLLLASLLTLAASIASAGPAPPQRPAIQPLPAAAPRVHCAHPRALRLRRFEDGSAQLRCGARVLVRVSVPG